METSLLNRRQRFIPLPLSSQGMEEGEGGDLSPLKAWRKVKVETSLLNRRQRFLPPPLSCQGMEEGEGGDLPPQPPPEVPSSSALLSRHGGR